MDGVRVIVDEAKEKTTLANTRITNQQNFKGVIVVATHNSRNRTHVFFFCFTLKTENHSTMIISISFSQKEWRIDKENELREGIREKAKMNETMQVVQAVESLVQENG